MPLSKERLLPALGQLNSLCLIFPSSLVPLLPVIVIDNCLDRLTGIFTPNASVYAVSSRVNCVCGDVTRIRRALRTYARVDTVYMSPPWGGPSPPHPLKFFEICIAGNFGPLQKL
uniref:Trimethylguanosine synthase n=1 Tax=Echinococcus granulosus TaxID=6210 RepID=A0A068WQL7_ECHGR|nr:RNA cap guanine N2 methyltransferase [Echinococcus granulosus]